MAPRIPSPCASGERVRERGAWTASAGLWARGKKTKHQTPNIKHQINSKSQAQRQRGCDRFWNLKFGISLELGFLLFHNRGDVHIGIGREPLRLTAAVNLEIEFLRAARLALSRPDWERGCGQDCGSGEGEGPFYKAAAR